MIHVKGFFRDYWKAIMSVNVWLLLLLSCYMVPSDVTYLYSTVWAGLGAFTALVFVIGYLRYSKPSKDPVTHQRAWVGEWAWLLAQACITVFTIGLAFYLRVLNYPAALFTVERVEQYRFASAVFLTAFLLQLWLFWLWAARQFISRKQRGIRMRTPLTRPGDLTDEEYWELQRALQQAATDAARDAYRPRLAPNTPKDDVH